MSTHVTPLTRSPAAVDVLRRQAWLLWRSRAALLPLLLLPGSLLAVALSFRQWLPSGFTAAEFELESLSALVILVGAAWGVLVWRDEPPSRRGYHRSLPVDTAHHDLLRVAAGAGWLAAGLLLYFVAGTVAVVLRGQMAALLAAGPGLWLGNLAAAFIGFGFLAALATLVERPVSWIVWGYLVFFALVLLLGQANPPLLETLLKGVFASPLGLGPAMTGGLDIARTRAAGGAGSIGPWIPAAGLWLLLSAAAVVGAARWRRTRSAA